MTRTLMATACSLLLLTVAPLLAQQPESQAASRATTRAESRPGEPERVDRVLEEIRARFDVPALGAALVQADGLRAIGVAGTRRRGGDEKVTLDDQWHLGSCTKSMTATMCAILVERGVLDWKLTVDDVFPDRRDRTHQDWRGVTLEQLLSNSSGAPGDLKFDGLWEKLWARQGTPSEQRLEMLSGVIRVAPAAPPGKKFIYSNAGFSIAGTMAECVAKTSYEELMQREIFGPLGMTSAGFGPPGVSEHVDQPRGHAKARLSEPVEPGPAADNPPAIAPAGLVHCSLGDWAKYIRAHMLGERGGSTLLKPETFKKLHTKMIGDYAFGWSVATRKWAHGRVLTHNGSNNLWFCVVWVAPERGVAVLAVTNQGGTRAQSAIDEACGALIGRFLDD